MPQLLQPTDTQITDIADELESGLRVFWNFSNGKLLVLPPEEAINAIDTEPFQEDLDELENNRTDYFEIEKVSSREGFYIMTDFVETQSVPEGWRKRLAFALEQKKPLARFKNTVDDSPVRDAFRKQRYIEWVRRCLLEASDT